MCMLSVIFVALKKDTGNWLLMYNISGVHTHSCKL